MALSSSASQGRPTGSLGKESAMPHTKVGHFESFSNQMKLASPGRGSSEESHSVEVAGYQTSTSSEAASMTKKHKSGHQGQRASSSKQVPYGERLPKRGLRRVVSAMPGDVSP